MERKKDSMQWLKNGVEGSLHTGHLHLRSRGGSRHRAEITREQNGLREKNIRVFPGTRWISSRNWVLSLFLSWSVFSHGDWWVSVVLKGREKE